jgi:hypothetical protein
MHDGPPVLVSVKIAPENAPVERFGTSLDLELL